MCRLVIAALRPSEALRELRILTMGLVEASAYDPYLEAASKGKRVSHGDGWGLAAIGIARGRPVVLNHKSILPIYNEMSRSILELFMDRLGMYDELYLAIHARASSRGEPYGAEYAHPYRVDTEFGAIWFVHNGGVDKVSIARELGLSPWLYTDSQMLAIYIAKRLERCATKLDDLDSCVASIYRDARRFLSTCSALHTGLLVLYQDAARLYASAYVAEWDKCNDEKKLYYQLYSFAKPSIVAMASSTLMLYVGKAIELAPVSHGVYRLEIDRIEKISD